MRIEQVDFVSVPTRDRARAVAWYRDVLGLPVSASRAGEVEAPGLTLSFWTPEGAGRELRPERERHRLPRHRRRGGRRGGACRRLGGDRNRRHRRLPDGL